MAREDWMNPGTYNWTPHMGHDYGGWGGQEAQAKVQQQWYRDPSWGGHIVYNPQYGFQDLQSVQDFYTGWKGKGDDYDYSDPSNFRKAFRKAGFEKQQSNTGDWSQFYNDEAHRVVSHQEKQANQGMWGGGGGNPWDQGSGQQWGGGGGQNPWSNPWGEGTGYGGGGPGYNPIGGDPNTWGPGKTDGDLWNQDKKIDSVNYGYGGTGTGYGYYRGGRD